MGEALRRIRLPVFMVQREEPLGADTAGSWRSAPPTGEQGWHPLAGYAPPCLPERLGDQGFCADLGLRFPYIGGSMAKGISSVAMVEELGKAGMLGFFGAAGLPFATVEAAVDRLTGAQFPCGFNLIHSPHEPDLEKALAELYIRKR